MKTPHRAHSRLTGCISVALLLAGAGLVKAQFEWYDSPMYRDPDLAAPPVRYVLADRARKLWVKALEHPQADLRAKAAEAIGEARRRGVTGLEATIPDLTAALDRKDQHAPV